MRPWLQLRPLLVVLVVEGFDLVVVIVDVLFVPRGLLPRLVIEPLLHALFE